MGHIVLRLYPDGRIEQATCAKCWKDRERLLAYSMYLQPGLAALDVAARLWQDLTRAPGGSGQRPDDQAAGSRNGKC